MFLRRKVCRNPACKRLIHRSLTHFSCQPRGLVNPPLSSTLLILLVPCMRIAGATAALHMQSISVFPTSNSFAAEVVAAEDSKGRINTAWVDQSGGSAGPGNSPMALAVRPRNDRAKEAYLVESSASIYSLDMTIYELDDAHIVWVSRSSGATETRSQTERLETRHPISVVCYLRAYSTGLFWGSPKLVLDSQADSVWASITLAYDSTLYLAWTEAPRLSSIDIASTA